MTTSILQMIEIKPQIQLLVKITHNSYVICQESSPFASQCRDFSLKEIQTLETQNSIKQTKQQTQNPAGFHRFSLQAGL